MATGTWTSLQYNSTRQYVRWRNARIPIGPSGTIARESHRYLTHNTGRQYILASGKTHETNNAEIARSLLLCNVFLSFEYIK